MKEHPDLLAEFDAEVTAELAQWATEDSSRGALARLFLEIGPHCFSDWFHEERQRGTSAQNLGCAIANAVANIIMPMALRARELAPEAATDLLLMARKIFLQSIEPGQGFLIVQVDTRTGEQILATTDGLTARKQPDKRP